MAYDYADLLSHNRPQALSPNMTYLESTLPSSSPGSPQISQMMINTPPTQFEMHDSSNSSNSPISYPSDSLRASAEYSISSTPDNGDLQQRRIGNSSMSSQDKDSKPDVHLRRRAQNRASQRAFRERKEKRVKDLEHQLEDLQEKHQDLLQSYSRQADEVTRLSHRLTALLSEFETLRSSREGSSNELLVPRRHNKFDAFSSHEMYYDGPHCCSNESAFNIDKDFGLNSCDDLV